MGADGQNLPPAGPPDSGLGAQRHPEGSSRGSESSGAAAGGAGGWATAIGSFETFGGLAASTAGSYGETLRRLRPHLGAVAGIGADALRAAMESEFSESAPASWNRHVSAVRSFFGYLLEQGLIDVDPSARLRRRRGGANRAPGQRVLSRDFVGALCRDKSHSLRDRTLWSVAYESAARAAEVLQLDVQTLDVHRRRSVVVGKGGDAETILWDTFSNRLLVQLTRGRSEGPVFLTDSPGTMKAPADTCQVTGRGRLSYRRAAEVFKAATAGATLHQLRHSRLTHLAEDGCDVMILKALSRHSTVRSLEVYVRPSDDSVAAQLSGSGL